MHRIGATKVFFHLGCRPRKGKNLCNARDLKCDPGFGKGGAERT